MEVGPFPVHHARHAANIAAFIDSFFAFNAEHLNEYLKSQIPFLLKKYETVGESNHINVVTYECGDIFTDRC